MASYPIRKDWFKWPDGGDLSWLTAKAAGGAAPVNGWTRVGDGPDLAHAIVVEMNGPDLSVNLPDGSLPADAVTAGTGRLVVVKSDGTEVDAQFIDRTGVIHCNVPAADIAPDLIAKVEYGGTVWTSPIALPAADAPDDATEVTVNVRKRKTKAN